MATLIQKIAKGNRKALTQSYEENKEKIFYIAQSIDKSQASKATIWAFKNVWNDIISSSNIREDDFSKLVILKLSGYLQRNSGNAKKDTLSVCEKLSEEFSSANTEITIPNDVNSAVMDTIDKIASPVEAHDKSTAITIAVIFVIIVICAVAMTLFFKPTGTFTTSDEGSSSNNVPETTTFSNKEHETSAISAKIDKSLIYNAIIDIKDYGTIEIQLDYENAPVTVANFVGLVQSGFYDGLTIHRVVENFVIQGGDPNGNGTGGSEETIYGEFTSNGWNNTLTHTRGAISMARSYDPDSASSQFFIVHQDSISLDGAYAVFGYVTEGMDVVDAICEAVTPIDQMGLVDTKDQPVINSITISTVEKESAE